MSDDEGFSWVFESLVGFLTGPVWEAAVLTFIEKKSVVFDPVEGDEDEYRNIHDEYKNLVDTLLGSYMEDLGITPEDFEKACVETEKNIHSQFRKRGSLPAVERSARPIAEPGPSTGETYRLASSLANDGSLAKPTNMAAPPLDTPRRLREENSLFEQLWAADDYETFKRMMTQKNIELQLQALDLLAHQYGLLPESFLPDNDYEPSQEEKTIMETVVKRYIEENPEESDAEKQSQQQEVIRATKAQLQEERQREKRLLEQAMESSLHDSPKVDYEKPLEVTKMTEVSDEEARRRMEYLRQQRDKLLALKKQEREKLLQAQGGEERPRSARAARKAVAEGAEEGPDPKLLAFRKSLAARLKAEVIDNKL